VYVVGSIYHTLFPSLHRFRSKTVLGQIASVFAAPAVMLLTLTLPVVVTPYESAHHSREKTPGEEQGNLIDFEEEGIERILIAEEEVEEEMHGMAYNKWLTAAQCLFGPLFCAAVLFGMCTFSSFVPALINCRLKQTLSTVGVAFGGYRWFCCFCSRCLVRK
jgi:sodium/potassium/calcium exchanger 6